MPKLARDRMPKLRFHAHSGQFFVQFPGERARYLGLDRAEATRRYDAECVRWIGRGRQPEPEDDGPALRFGELAARFRARLVAAGSGPATLKVVDAALAPALALHAELPADQFGPSAYKAVRAAMVGKGLAQSTVRRYLTRIRQLVRWAVESELLPPDRAWALAAVAPPPRAEAGRRTPPVRPPRPEHVEAVLAVIAPLYGDLIRLQRLTGMRPGEACRVNAAEVDRAGPVWYYRPERHKTDEYQERVVRIGPQAQAILGPRLDRGRWAFPAPRSPRRPLDPDVYLQAVVAACRRAGIPRWRPNQLRHEAATRLRAACGPEVAQAQLGHARINQTERYALPHGEAADRAIAELG